MLRGLCTWSPIFTTGNQSSAAVWSIEREGGRDKSAAVGWAAGGWFCCEMCDGTRNSRAAVFGKSRFFSIEIETALGQIAHTATMTCQKELLRDRPHGSVQMHSAQTVRGIGAME